MGRRWNLDIFFVSFRRTFFMEIEGYVDGKVGSLWYYLIGMKERLEVEYGKVVFFNKST